MSARAARALSVAAIVLAGAVYAGSLSGEYVYDDHRFVERNPAVEEGAPLAAWFADPSTQTADGSHQGIWRPLRTVSFRVVRLLGPGPGPQRAANLALHLANGLLTFALLRRLLGPDRPVPALLGALAFVLHPLATEAVAWVSGRGDLLAAAGMLTASLLFTRGGRIAMVGVHLAFAAALLAKESAVVLPLILVALAAWRGGLSGVRARFRDWAPAFAVLAAWVVARSAVLSEGFAQGTGRGLEPGVLAATTFTEGLYYLLAAAFPVGLTFDWHVPSAPDAPGLAAFGFLACAALAWIVWRRRREDPVAGLAAFWFVAALIPVTVLQVAFPLKILVANRFAYPALFAVALLLGRLAGNGRRAAALAAVVLLAFVPLTAARASAWSSDARLWDDVIRQDPGNPTALYGAGAVAAGSGDWRRAADLLVRAAARDPRHPGIAALLGEVMERLAAAEARGSGEERRLLARAFEAYHVAVRTWQGGVREEVRLYRLTLANAAWLALAAGRADLAIDHVRHLLADEGPFPPPGAARDRVLRRLEGLAEAFREGGETDLADGLLTLRKGLSPGGDR